MRVLAIGAHPDDVELLCAGTLARYASDGHDVFIAIATDGGAGGQVGKTGKTATVREEEARAAAEVIGAGLIWMGFEDGFLFDDRPTRLGFIDAIRQAAPDVVFAHSPTDYHPDHRAAGRLAADARIPASAAAIRTPYPAAKIPHYFFMDTVGGVDFEPELFVEVTEVMDTRHKMLAAHESQVGSLVIPGMGYHDLMERQAAFRGQQAGVKHAEGFRSLRAHPTTGGPHQLPTINGAGGVTGRDAVET